MTEIAALVLSLPTRDSTVRMRVWRALKATGCGVLRDGMYLLPRDAAGFEVLSEVESQVRAAGGFAMTVDLGLSGPAQQDHVRGLFDRGEQYAELVDEIAAARGGLAKLGARKAEAAASRLQKTFEELAAIDYFPGEARSQAAAALDAFKGELRRLYSRGEPRPLAGQARSVDRKRFQGRLWATRKDLWIDRLASAWLIKRFIDKEARFAWIASPRSCPKGAVGFDFDGAEFTHVGSHVTFEVLLASFGLEGDPALARLAALVHSLDVGGEPVPEAVGFEAVLAGARERLPDDDALLLEIGAVLDSLYAHFERDTPRAARPQ